jgi:hypothetical protein
VPFRAFVERGTERLARSEDVGFGQRRIAVAGRLAAALPDPDGGAAAVGRAAGVVGRGRAAGRVIHVTVGRAAGGSPDIVRARCSPKRGALTATRDVGSRQLALRAAVAA